MSDNLDRRHFLGVSAASGLALATLPARAAVKGANEKILVGVMGTGGRGLALAAGFENLQNVEVAYVCDVDRKRAEAVLNSDEDMDAIKEANELARRFRVDGVPIFRRAAVRNIPALL